MGNLPVNFNDPSGHDPKGDCYDKAYCKYEDLTPGQLISRDLEGHGGTRCGKMAIDPVCADRNKRLINDTEAYLKNHSEYQISKDKSFCAGSAGNPCRNLEIYADIRVDYWTSRAGGDVSEAYKLMFYYDFDYQTADLKFDPSRMNWATTGLDSTSFVASVAALFLAPEYAIYANGVAYTSGGISGLFSLTQQDYLGAGLSGGGFIKPPYGTLASGLSVVHDFSAGFYSVPYTPSIVR